MRFCRHLVAESQRRQKFGPQNWGSGGPTPLDQHLRGGGKAVAQGSRMSKGNLVLRYLNLKFPSINVNMRR